jgi:WD40 repeat protein
MFKNENIIKLIFGNLKIFQRKITCKSLNNSITLKIMLNLKICIQHKYTLKENEENNFTHLISLPDGNIATGTVNGNIKIWNAKKEFICEKELKGHTDDINIIEALPNGDLITNCCGRITKRWSYSQGYRCVITNSNLPGYILCILPYQHDRIIISDDEGYTKIFNYNLNVITVVSESYYDTYDYKLLSNGHVLACLQSNFPKLVFRDPQHNFEVVGSIDGKIEEGNSEDEHMEDEEERETCYALLPNGNIATGFEEDGIKIYDIKNEYKLTKSIKDAHQYEITSMLVINERYLVTSAFSIKLWDCLNDYECVKIIECHRPIRSMIFYSGSYLISPYKDVINIWDVNNGFKRFSMLMNKNSELKTLPDNYLASFSRNTVKLWQFE